MQYDDDPDLKFDLYDHKKKLKMLIQFEDELIKIDTEKPENRNKQ